MATADQLLELIFSWIEQRECCAEQLEKLAEELETLRKICNISKTCGSTLSVLGAACKIGAGVATVASGGVAAPLLGLLGAGIIFKGVGSTVSAVTKITERFLSSKTMKEALKVEKESNKIVEKIQELFQQLFEQLFEQLSQHLDPEKKVVSPLTDPDKQDQHIITELLAAMLNLNISGNELESFLEAGPRYKGFDQKFNLGVNTDSNEPKFVNLGPGYEGFDQRFNFRLSTDNNEPQCFSDAGPRCVTPQTVIVTAAVMLVVIGISAVFIHQVSGKKNKFMFANKGRMSLPELPELLSLQTSLTGIDMVMRGAVDMLFELPEAIEQWKELIKNNHVTKASQSLRDTSDEILKSTQQLKELLGDIKMGLNKMAEIQQEHKEETQIQEEAQISSAVEQQSTHESSETQEDEESEESEEEKDDEASIRVGLLNIRSMRNKTDIVLKLITENNLDVFCTTETWLDAETGHGVLEEASPEGFSFYHQPRPRTRRSRGRGKRASKKVERGGVAIQFSKHVFQRKMSRFKTDIKGCECVVAILQRDEWDEPIAIINVYHPPGYIKDQALVFLFLFGILLWEVSLKYNNIIVTGDFNFWFGDKQKSSTKWFQEFWWMDWFLVQHVKEPTRKGEKGHTLDLVFTSNVEIYDLKVKPVSDRVSDHHAVYFNARPVNHNKKVKRIKKSK